MSLGNIYVNENLVHDYNLCERQRKYCFAAPSSKSHGGWTMNIGGFNHPCFTFVSQFPNVPGPDPFLQMAVHFLDLGLKIFLLLSHVIVVIGIK